MCGPHGRGCCLLGLVLTSSDFDLPPQLRPQPPLSFEELAQGSPASDKDSLVHGSATREEGKPSHRH